MPFRQTVALLVVSFLMSMLVLGCASPKTFGDSDPPGAYVLRMVAAEERLLAPTPPAFNRADPGTNPDGAPSVAAVLPGRTHILSPQMRRENVLAWDRALWIHTVIDQMYALFLEAHPPPAPVSAMRCPAGPIKWELDSVFGAASPWIESIAWRESRCTADAYNPSGSAGLLQLNGHYDLLLKVCPGTHPALSRFDYGCNALAGYNLYLVAGASPWRL